ncbi:hypothetical protein BOX15_Mlig024265g14 [Macrostomum lignano]|uniref:Solute carrier family 12 member 9 n=2 Tax=Macrostomum lignano TaxID=282301 RepID=A0A267E2Q1_9PLAT|nr:hypothetical protein BOX15_Mlig024265g14 [Macrostomum lignano]
MSSVEKEGLLSATAGAGSGLPTKETQGQPASVPVQHNELYREIDSDSEQQPWWKANFLITTQRVTFGTWDGVFTSCVMNIFGTLVFLRAGWLVGQAGLPLALLACCLTATVGLLTALSAIGVCLQCGVESGGVHSLLGRVLGDKFGSAIGLVYCLGQAIGVSLCTAGLGESVANMFGIVGSDWASRAFALVLTATLLAVAGAGVKWVIRLQLLLLAVVVLAVFDFVIGSGFRGSVTNDNGVLGYGSGAVGNNTRPEFSEGETFLTVLGVFFPTITGVLAGVNMAGDLADPLRSIPTGTMSAIGASFVLYVTFVIVLGATCSRVALQSDYLIGQQVSLLGPVFLCGLYVSSLSSALGGLTAASRVLSAIAHSTQLPGLRHLSVHKFSAQVPIYALIAVAVVTIAFNIAGSLNILAPIVAMPFLATYATVCYANFALEMSKKIGNQHIGRNSKSDQQAGTGGDLDTLFPDAGPASNRGPDEAPLKGEVSTVWSRLANGWLSLFSCCACLAVMLAINWIYALVTSLLVVGLHVYVGHFCPGASPGVADFSLIGWIQSLRRGGGGHGGSAGGFGIVSARPPPKPGTEGALLTQDNEDYAERGKYHQSRQLDPRLVPDDLE